MILDCAALHPGYAGFVAETGEAIWHAELYRLRGWILSAAPSADAAAVEGCYRQALAIAARQQARSLFCAGCAGATRYASKPRRSQRERDWKLRTFAGSKARYSNFEESQMITFKSGRFRTEAFFTVYPDWTQPEITVVRNHVLAIRTSLHDLKLKARSEMIDSRTDIPADNPHKAKWIERVRQFWQVLHEMEGDLGAGGFIFSEIVFRKLDLGPGKYANESHFGLTGWITLNVNPGKDFFTAVPNQQQATLFHELTHLYGTEDDDHFLNNPEILDDMYEKGHVIQAVFKKARKQTLQGN